jgi:transcriptional regulator with XRE-family HTH domain
VLSDVVAEQLVRLRKKADLTREQLASRCASFGWPALTYGVIGSIETGRRVTPDAPRRREITVDELVGLSVALGVAPAQLIAPVGEPDEVEILPGRSDDPWTAYRWLIGEFPTELVGEERDPTTLWYRTDEAGTQLLTYRRHHNALFNYLRSRHEAGIQAGGQLATLAGVRRDMHQAGWALPAVPDDVRAALAEPLLQFGFEQDDDGSLRYVGPSLPLDEEIQ